jgi:hypothetical protein
MDERLGRHPEFTALPDEFCSTDSQAVLPPNITLLWEKPIPQDIQLSDSTMKCGPHGWQSQSKAKEIRRTDTEMSPETHLALARSQRAIAALQVRLVVQYSRYQQDAE